jgi:uncharacterized membrane protein HdeD (DUF308 family)
MSLIAPFSPALGVIYRKSWKQLFLLGLLLVVLGVFAISAATATTLLSTVFLGCIIFFSGVVLLFDTFGFWWRKWSGFLTHALLTLLYLYVGYYLIRHPEEGAISLTFILGLFYMFVGVCRLAFSAAYRGPSWGWAFFNGIVTLLIGVMIFSSWPVSGLFIIGLFVGIDLIFAGWAYMTAGLAAKYFK